MNTEYKKLLDVILYLHGPRVADLYDKIAKGEVKIKVEVKK